MRVILSLLSSHAAERQAVWLQAGQSLTVGRTADADFSIPDDPTLSGIHFQLKCTRTHCELVDLDSTGGTFVGSQQVAEAVVRDGDTIRAGETEFLIRIEGDDPDAVPLRQTKPATTNVRRKPQKPPVYRQREIGNGLLCWHGTQPLPTPLEVFTLLASATRPSLLVDFIAAEHPIPPELTEPIFLYNWLPPESAAGLSPVFVPSDDPAPLPPLVGTCWGSDALMVFCSQLDTPALLEHLRAVCQGARGLHHPASDDKLLGLATPSLVVPLLENASEKEFKFLFEGLDAIFCQGESPDDWQLLTISSAVDRWHRLGFERDPTDVPPPVFEPDEAAPADTPPAK